MDQIISQKIEVFCKKMNKLIDELNKELGIESQEDNKTEKPCAEDLIGKSIRFGDMEWTVLEQDDDSLFIVANTLLPDVYEFDTKGRNVWAKSSMREKLHKWLKEWAKKNDVDEYIYTIITDSTDEAAEVLGTSDDRVRLLTLEEQLRYRRLGLLPKYDDWQWTISASRGSAYSAWFVGSSGYVDPNYASYSHRCAPSVYISLEAPFERID